MLKALYWLPPHVFALMGVMLVLMALLPLLAMPKAGQALQPAARTFRRGYLVGLLSCSSLLVLSGCGTAPLQVPQCPPVPAELLTPPQAPVMLQPTSPSPTPGPTRPKTPRDAASTERTTSS